MRRILFPLFALVFAGGTALFVNDWMESQKRAALAEVQPVTIVKEAEFVEVLVAAERLTPGSFIKPGVLRWQKWPAVELPESYIVRGGEADAGFEGAVVRHVLAAGDPIIVENLVRPGDRGFLAAVLDPDMRAVSVPVDEASSNAGLILPGDRVDLILTQTVTEEGADRATRRVSETVLENLRVIAMGRSLHTEPDAEAASSSVRTATLEVDPAGAELVALVTELGKLSLSLRSIATTGDLMTGATSREAVTWDSDVSSVLGSGSHSRPRLLVIRGGVSEQVQSSEGADQ